MKSPTRPTARAARAAVVGTLTMAGLVAGCASSPPSETPRTPTETQRLSQENVELRRDLLVERMERERMASGAGSVQPDSPGRTSQPERTPAPPVVETGVVIADDRSVPVEMGGRIEEIDVEPPPIPPRAEDAIAVEVLPADPVAEPSSAEPSSSEPAPAASTPVPAPRTPGATAPRPADRPVTDAGQALYDQAYSLYHRRQYAESEAGFRRFLDAHSDTHLADNALFWIGESRLARGDAAGALEAFADTVERYPEGNKVADSLLSGGRSLERLEQTTQAAETYREVLRRFPDSAAALTAQERLEALGATR